MEGYFYTTKYWKIVLVEDQMYFGRLVIKTVEPRTSLPDLTEEEQKDFFIVSKKLELFFKEAFNATMFNYSCLMNNAYRDGETPHVHFHFRPRYKDPITVLGKTYTDPNFGEHYLSPTLIKEEPITLSQKTRSHITERCRTYLEEHI